MQLTTLLTSLALALPILADPVAAPLPAGLTPARQFKRDSSSHLQPRLDVDPNVVCGSNYEECQSGWCCSSNTPCAGEIEGIPVCKDPSFTLGPLKGTAVATPYKNLEGVLSSMEGKLSSLAGDYNIGEITAAPTMTGGSGNAAATTGAAPAVRPLGFGAGFVGTVAVWGVAALGGAAWILLN